MDMKDKVWKTASLAAAIVILWSAYFAGVHAQQSATNLGTQGSATNWLGYLVVGEQESMDRIARGLHPAVNGKVQVGLRSDGIVVWRWDKARETK